MVARVLGQLAALLLTDKTPGAGLIARPPLTQADRQVIYDRLSQVALEYPGAGSPPIPPALSEDGVNQLLERLTGIISLWHDPYWTQHPQHPLWQLGLHTRPYATRIRDLCAVDSITMEFAHVDGSEDASARMRVSNVMIDRSYKFLVPPSSERPVEVSAHERSGTDTACAKLDSDQNFFVAPNDVAAFEGVTLAQAAITSASQPALPYVLSCDRKDAEACRKDIASAHASNIWVGKCAPPDVSPESACDVMLDGNDLVITVKSGAISQVDVHQTVVIADELAD
ncbi:MAG TPA: hypothetical protein VGG10_00475 [Rhizomicrobium sp.]